MTKFLRLLISGLMVFISLSSLYAQGEPSVDFMKRYNIEMAKKNDLSIRYKNIWNEYLVQAKRMGLQNANEKDLYFLHRYVKSISFNPRNVYNILPANFNINNKLENHIIYMRKDRSPFQLYAFNENISLSIFKSICPFVLVDFYFRHPFEDTPAVEIKTNSDGIIKSDTSAFNHLNKNDALQTFTTGLAFYILIGKERTYFYSKTEDNFRNLYLLVGDKVLDGIDIR